MNGHVILLIILLSLIGFQLRGQETSSDKKNQQKSTDIIIPPIEESIEMLTGSSIDNLSASIELKAQDPSNGHAALKLFHSNGSSGVLLSNNEDNDNGFYINSFGDPINLSFNYGVEFFNPDFSIATTRLLNIQSDGKFQFGPGASSGAFIDMTTPAFSNITDLLTIKRWGDSEPKWALKSDRVEQNVNHYLTGDLDITDGQIVLKDEGNVLWDVSGVGGFNVRVNQWVYGNFTQSNGSSTFLGNVNLNQVPLNIYNETAHIDNDGWQIHLNNDDEGEDDSNNWYVGASHDNWQIGDDKLVFSKGTNSGSDWIMYLHRTGQSVPNDMGGASGGVFMAVNGSAYAEDFWVQGPQMSAFHKSTQEDFLDQLKNIEVYSNKSGQKHALSTKLPKSSITKSLERSDKAYVNYTEIIAITVGALQEQIKENNILKERIARLEKLIENR